MEKFNYVIIVKNKFYCVFKKTGLEKKQCLKEKNSLLK